MAVYNLRNQQAVTRAIPGYIRAARVCALYVLNPYLLAAKTLLFLAILGPLFLPGRCHGGRSQRDDEDSVVGDGASAAFLIPCTLVPRPPFVPPPPPSSRPSIFKFDLRAAGYAN